MVSRFLNVVFIPHFRENKTLRYQLEQTLQKISPWEQTEEQLKSFRIELEKKTVCYIFYFLIKAIFSNG